LPDPFATLSYALRLERLTLLFLYQQNFFEKRVSDYQKAGVMAKQNAKEGGDETNKGSLFSLEEDF